MKTERKLSSVDSTLKTFLKVVPGFEPIVMALSVKATVKDLPVKLQTSSLKQRKKLFADLVSSVFLVIWLLLLDSET